MSRPAGAPIGRGPECRTLAWVYRDADGWRFEVSPGPGKEDGAACTVAVLFENGSFGIPYPTQVGLRSTRAIMHRHEEISVNEAEAIYAAAVERFGGAGDDVEAFLASYLVEAHTFTTYPVRYGAVKNTGAIALGAAGAMGGAWCIFISLRAVVQWRAAYLRRRRASEILKSSMCPVCGYDLRGLPERRCPECGFGWSQVATVRASHTTPPTALHRAR